MSFDTKRIYELLPAIYRIRDAAQGKPLEALLSIIAEQVAVLEEDLEQLYDDRFIETCASWAIPYIGDMVGSRPLISIPNVRFGRRAEVANTLAYRRRKGTAAVVEQLAADVTAWGANVVEFFADLATTQYLDHVRPGNSSFASLHRAAALELVGTPFDPVVRTADVRRIAPRRGRYNIANLGIFLWRIDADPLRGVRAAQTPASPPDPSRFLFDPLGRNIPLFNSPATEEEITHLATPANVPSPIGRRELRDNFASHYGPAASFRILADGKEVPAGSITVCDLTDWSVVPTNKIAVDPELGRIAWSPLLAAPGKVNVDFHQGLAAEMGGGGYGRGTTFAPRTMRVEAVSFGTRTIQNAIQTLGANTGVVEIRDGETYDEAVAISLAATQSLEIRVEDERRAAALPSRPWSLAGAVDSVLTFNGILFGPAGLRVEPDAGVGQPNLLGKLLIRHCTLAGPLVIDSDSTVVEIDNSILAGGLRTSAGVTVILRNTILAAPAGKAAAYSGAPLKAINATILGTVDTRRLDASNSVFTGIVRVAEVQDGCVRFSFIPPESRTARRFKCISAPPPIFTTRIFGRPAFAQLSHLCPIEIRQGADDEAEMGAFHDAFQPQRVANLQTRLDEYLRFGMEAGIIFAS